MTNPMDNRHRILWEGVLTVVNEITKRLPDAYEWAGLPGRWTHPYGSDQSPAAYTDYPVEFNRPDRPTGAKCSVEYDVGMPDGSRKRYRITAIVEEIDV